MKSKFSLLALFSVMSLEAGFDGFCVSVSNIAVIGDPSLPIIGAGGELLPLGTGVVAVGFFADSDVINPMDFVATLSGFTTFDTEIGGFIELAPGLFDPTFADDIPFGGNEFTGNNITLIFGNGSTLAASDELAIFESDVVFSSVNVVGLGGASVPVQTGSGTLLLGNSGGPVNVFAPNDPQNFVPFSDTIQLVSVVPEPSVALFAGFALLGGFVRRRR